MMVSCLIFGVELELASGDVVVFYFGSDFHSGCDATILLFVFKLAFDFGVELD